MHIICAHSKVTFVENTGVHDCSLPNVFLFTDEIYATCSFHLTENNVRLNIAPWA